MANVANKRIKKIRPENAVTAEGIVVRCRFIRSFKIKVGLVARTNYIYKLKIRVQGLEKPLKCKVKERDGWNAAVVHGVRALGRAFGAGKPVKKGERLIVVYDRTKPKKCNISG